MNRSGVTRSGLLLTAPAACVPTAPVPEGPPPSGSVTNACDGGRTLVATHGRENGRDVVRLNPTGAGEEMLISFPVAEGLQYSWPPDGSYHIWAQRNGIGMLSYRDGGRGTTPPVLTNCRA